MNTQKISIKTLLGSGLVAALSMAPLAQADQNPFALKSLTQGYMIAEADQAAGDDKMKDGNCSAEMMSGSENGEQKGKEGNCSAEMQGGDHDADKMK